MLKLKMLMLWLRLIMLKKLEQFAKDYIDCEEKEYCRMIDEYNED